MADGAGRATGARGVLPGVHGGSGVDVQAASSAITVTIADDVAPACKRGQRTRTPDSAVSEMSAFEKRCVDAGRIMGRPFLTAQIFESTPCGLR